MKALFALLLLTSCSTMTEEEKYEREAAKAEARDEFIIRAEGCHQAGGIMIFKRDGSSMKHWTKFDYQSAYCTSRDSFSRIF